MIEEAPSPTLDATQREAVCAAARKAAAAVNYVGAGTIEFVSDGKEVFFIEMNTRLQVEHPVTELITGVDLVEWQLRVAFGEKLPLAQDEIKLNGHAIEARVYAENPQKNFMPSVGRIKTWRTPDAVDGLRIDAGYRGGDAVSPYYDAMLAKVIAWAPTRQAAIERLNRGLEETDVRGIVTNIPFLSALITHPKVRANTIDTGFIERELKKLTEASSALGDLELLRRGGRHRQRRSRSPRARIRRGRRLAGCRSEGGNGYSRSVRGRAPSIKVTLHYGSGPMTLSIGKHEFVFATSPADGGGFDLTIDGMKSRVTAVIEGHELYLRTRNGRFDLHWVDPFGGETEEQVGEDKIVAPLAGHRGGAAGRGGRNAGEGRCDPDPRSHEDGADPARALCGRVEEDQVQGRRYRRRRRRACRNRTGGVMSDRVHIVEVGPRDGLQNEKTPVSVADRIAFVEALIAAGLHTVEVGAFVSPKAIPQMVGSAEVLRGVSHHT